MQEMEKDDLINPSKIESPPLNKQAKSVQFK